MDASRYPEGWLLSGEAHLKIGELDDAERSAREADRLDSKGQFPKIAELLGWIFVERSNSASDAERSRLYAAAEAEFQKYLKVAPQTTHTEEVRSALKELQSIVPEGAASAALEDSILPPAPAPAAPATSVMPLISVTTRLVEINVMATSGADAVKDLAKAEFSVFDNGKKQQIAFFEKNVRRAAADAPRPPAPANEFTNIPVGAAKEAAGAVLVVWDMLNSQFTNQVLAKSAVLKSVSAARPGDHVGMYVVNSQKMFFQDFTNNGDQLASVVEKFAKAPDLFNMLPSEAAQRKRADMTQQAIWEIRSHLARLPGRKSVVWVGDEPPMSLYGADFPVYLVDARGLMTAPGFRAEANQPRIEHPDGTVEILPVPAFFPSFDAWQRIAASTGGRAFINSNDIEGAINRAIRDADLTYTLGFYPEPPAPGDRPFHQLKLEVARSGVDLRYRQRYATVAYQPPPDRLVADAVQSAVDSTQIGLTARMEKSGSSWRITLSIDAGDLTVEGGDRRTGSAELVFVQRSANGKELDRTTRDLALNFDEARYQAVLKQGLVTAVTLEPKPGAVAMKAVVLDRASNNLGSLTIPAP